MVNAKKTSHSKCAIDYADTSPGSVALDTEQKATKTWKSKQRGWHFIASQFREERETANGHPVKSDDGPSFLII